jgi:hypothetical protein
MKDTLDKESVDIIIAEIETRNQNAVTWAEERYRQKDLEGYVKLMGQAEGLAMAHHLIMDELRKC